MTCTLKYGHAYCPCCSSEIDLSKPHEGFTRSLELFMPGEELLVFFLCDVCGNKFKFGNSDMQQNMARLAFKSIKDRPDSSYSVVTLSSLIVNDGNVADALERGVNLPKEIIAQFQNGEISGNELYALAMLQELDVLMEAHHDLP